MRKNMSITDRSIRIIIAAVVAALYFSGMIASTLGLVLLAVAAIFVLTSFVGFCPLYALFGMRTGSSQRS